MAVNYDAATQQIEGVAAASAVAYPEGFMQPFGATSMEVGGGGGLPAVAPASSANDPAMMETGVVDEAALKLAAQVKAAVPAALAFAKSHPTQSLSGSWVLVKEKSDRMEWYLRTMGVADLAIEAQAKCEEDSETRNTIILNHNMFIICKKTKINDFTEIYTLGQEKITTARHGIKHATVVLREEGRLDAIQVTTTMPTSNGSLHLTEYRALVDRGMGVAQELHITNTTTGARNVTKRKWKRVEVTQEDREELYEERLQPPVA